MKKNHWIPALGLFVTILSSYFLVFPDVQNDGQFFTDEDGLVENIGALGFLIAALFFGYCFWYSNRNQQWAMAAKRNYWYLLLALLFFFAFGEEISWGQRIFGWETPEAVSQINYQQETNLHNLDYFVNRPEQLAGGSDLLALLLVFNMGRLFFYFWFSFLVVIPLLHRFSPAWAARFKALNIPIAPLWIGGLMLANLLLANIFVFATQNYPFETSGSIDEFKESNYAVIIAALAVFWVWNKSYLYKAS